MGSTITYADRLQAQKATQKAAQKRGKLVTYERDKPRDSAKAALLRKYGEAENLIGPVVN